MAKRKVYQADEPDPEHNEHVDCGPNFKQKPKLSQGDIDKTVKLRPKPYNLKKQFKLDSFVVVVGKRRFGKSVWTRDQIRKIRQFYPDGGYVFTGSSHNKWWSQHFPDARIYDGFQPAVASEILKEQVGKLKRVQHGDGKDMIPFVLVILDDVGSQKGIAFDEVLHKFIFNGRHFKCCIFMLVQDLKMIGPKLRQNADLLATTYQSQLRTLECLHEDYAAYFNNKHEFYKMIHENTQDHGMVVIDQTEAHPDINDVFFTDTAELETEEFRVGDAQYWQESGCKWKTQLEEYYNLKEFDDIKKEQWETIVKKRWAESDKELAHEEDEALERMVVSSLALAPPEVQDAVAHKKDKIEDSRAKANRILSEMFIYREAGPNKK